MLVVVHLHAVDDADDVAAADDAVGGAAGEDGRHADARRPRRRAPPPARPPFWACSASSAAPTEVGLTLRRLLGGAARAAGPRERALHPRLLLAAADGGGRRLGALERLELAELLCKDVVAPRLLDHQRRPREGGTAGTAPRRAPVAAVRRLHADGCGDRVAPRRHRLVHPPPPLDPHGRALVGERQQARRRLDELARARAQHLAEEPEPRAQRHLVVVGRRRRRAAAAAARAARAALGAVAPATMASIW